LDQRDGRVDVHQPLVSVVVAEAAFGGRIEPAGEAALPNAASTAAAYFSDALGHAQEALRMAGECGSRAALIAAPRPPAVLDAEEGWAALGTLRATGEAAPPPAAVLGAQVFTGTVARSSRLAILVDAPPPAAVRDAEVFTGTGARSTRLAIFVDAPIPAAVRDAEVFTGTGAAPSTRLAIFVDAPIPAAVRAAEVFTGTGAAPSTRLAVILDAPPPAAVRFAQPWLATVNSLVAAAALSKNA
jgi:hypothetical protein